LKALKALFCIIKTIHLVPKLVCKNLALDQKFFKAKNTIIRTFDLAKKECTDFGTRSNVFKAKNTIIRTFNSSANKERTDFFIRSDH
jgi:hypothetical protein